jgi:inorganic pyrophosphatase
MASHEYDPDDNFGHAFHPQAAVDDEDALEQVAWQFLLLANPDDEDAALQQFGAFRQALDEAGDDPDVALLLREAIDWKAGFHVAEDDAQGLMEVLDELAGRWRLQIDWGLDDDDDALPDTSALLRAAFTQLRERHYSLWTLETGEATLAGWITRERDEEAMHLVAAALAMPARVGVG